jgi:hypothetical protein
VKVGGGVVPGTLGVSGVSVSAWVLATAVGDEKVVGVGNTGGDGVFVIVGKMPGAGELVGVEVAGGHHLSITGLTTQLIITAVRTARNSLPANRSIQPLIASRGLHCLGDGSEFGAGDGVSDTVGGGGVCGGVSVSVA